MLLPVPGGEVELAGGTGPVTAHETLLAELVVEVEELLGTSLGLADVELRLELDRELSLLELHGVAAEGPRPQTGRGGGAEQAEAGAEHGEVVAGGPDWI